MTELPAPTPVAENQDHPHRFVRHATLVAALTFTSRVLGLVRDTTLAACFGLTAMTDAFWIAFVIPNLLRRLFGEGALTAAFIPAYTTLRRSDAHSARRLVWACVALTAAGLVTLTLIGELALALVLRTGALSEHTALAMKLTTIMLPYMPMVCLVAVLAGVLHVHGRFGPPAMAPILMNLSMIVAALAASGRMSQQAAIEIVALSVVAVGAVQLVWLFAEAGKLEPPTREFKGAWPLLRPMLAATVPTAAALAVFQVNALLDSVIAFSLSPKSPDAPAMQVFGFTIDHPVRAGSVTALQFAQRLYQFPLGVFGIALATAIFPALARASAHNAPQRYRDILRKGLRLAIFIGLPATLGLVLVQFRLVRSIFEYKQFTIDDSRAVASLLQGYATAVWAYILVHLLTRAFYALKDPYTPVKVALAMVVLNIGLNLTLVWRLGAPALAWSTAISASLQAVILLWLIARRTPGLLTKDLFNAVGRSACVALIMSGVLIGISSLLDRGVLGRHAVLSELLALVALGVVVVIVCARLLRMTEPQWLFGHPVTQQTQEEL